MEHCTTKDEIISFIQNSTEEVNFKIAVFIAGMQAQKNLMGNQESRDLFCPAKNASFQKQGE